MTAELLEAPDRLNGSELSTAGMGRLSMPELVAAQAIRSCRLCRNPCYDAWIDGRDPNSAERTVAVEGSDASLGRLVRFVVFLGHDVEIVVKKRARAQGPARLLVAWAKAPPIA